MNVVIARRTEGVLSQADIKSMHQLRYQIFCQRLKWDVQTEADQEKDEFDRLVEATYMVVRDDIGDVVGCWRMLPTTGPNMLRDTFPQLLGGVEMPVSETVWELSRFATRTERSARAVSGYNRQLPLTMMRAIVDYACQRGITAFVTVTTLSIERMLRALKVNVTRIAAPIQVGIERAVALTVVIDQQTIDALNPEKAQPVQAMTVLPEARLEMPAANESPFDDEGQGQSVIALHAQAARRASQGQFGRLQANG